MSAKTLDNFFVDWESDAFGFGYGTGEQHVIPALKAFMGAIPPNGSGHPTYNYRVLEEVVGPVVAWLLINLLCHADVLEYGTSPRYGWLTPHGFALKQYLDSKTADELLGVLIHGDDYCLPDHCNCGDDGPCVNPFWPRR